MRLKIGFVLISLLSLFVLVTSSMAASETAPATPGSSHLSEQTITATNHPAKNAHSPSPSAHAPHGHQGHENLGENMPLWSCLPFACMLLSIALFPLLAPEFWHHHFAKVSAFWAATLAVPFLIALKGVALYEILHILIADYVPFIILLWSLYTVSGGILLRGSLRGNGKLPAIEVGYFIFYAGF